MAIRVLVVDDSAFMRRVIGEAIGSQPDLELAGVAHNGLDALLKVEQLLPDVVTLDVEMPEMDGLTALRHLMVRYPRPVVMLSTMTQRGAVTTLQALSMGAVDFVAKPSGSISLDFPSVRDELIQKIRVAARARIHSRTAVAQPVAPSASLAVTPRSRPFERVVVIGASTGGPRALGRLIPALPRDGRTAYALVQHMPAAFTKSLADRLNASSALDIREATSRDRLASDSMLVAPGDRHLVVTASGAIELDDSPRVHGVRPSVDVTLQSLAPHLGRRVVVAILTGMGVDGAAGAEAVHNAGGYVLAEDESTCVVYGMPRAVVERGVADRIVPLDEMAAAISAALVVKEAVL